MSDEMRDMSSRECFSSRVVYFLYYFYAISFPKRRKKSNSKHRDVDMIKRIEKKVHLVSKKKSQQYIHVNIVTIAKWKRVENLNKYKVYTSFTWRKKFFFSGREKQKNEGNFISVPWKNEIKINCFKYSFQLFMLHLKRLGSGAVYKWCHTRPRGRVGASQEWQTVNLCR